MKFTMYKKETTDKKYHENPYRAVNLQKMHTCLEIEKLIQRNAKTDICRNWRFLY